MLRAMQEIGLEADPWTQLEYAFFKTADFLCNQPGSESTHGAHYAVLKTAHSPKLKAAISGISSQRPVCGA